MSNNIPEVPWRFNERYLATDFVQNENVAVKEEADKLDWRGNSDKFVEEVAAWVRDNFYYPFDSGGNPSASGQLLRHQRGFMKWHFKRCVNYMWSLPNEVLVIGAGICIDTSNLVGSVLRAKALDNSWICLGDVNSSKDDTLLGRHAWIEIPYHNLAYLMETTVHDTGTKNLIQASKVYDRDSEWAQKAGLYYTVQAKYNESEFIGEGPLGAGILEVMGLPTNRVLLFGIERTKLQKPKQLYKEWRKEELIKENLLREAYRG